jgi:predicted nuclease of restriction endonuclease-like (RecB) superfamily
VNTELVNLYWELGEYISKNIEREKWGNGIVQNLAVYLKQNIPCQKGFSAQNLWRMKQFYETYKEYPKLSTMLRELNWSSHLHILSKTKSMEEKEFYLRLAIKEKYSARELERQINSGFYERCLLSDIKVSPAGKEKTRKRLTGKWSEKWSEKWFNRTADRSSDADKRKSKDFKGAII